MQRYIAFRKGSDTLLGRLVRVRTMSQYSHCEIILEAKGADGYGKAVGFSSQYGEGVRKKNLNLDKKGWDVIPVKLNEVRLQKTMERTMGMPYDYTGMLAWGSAFDDDLQDKKAWFCSELCAYILRLHYPWTYSPGSLYDLLVEGDADVASRMDVMWGP